MIKVRNKFSERIAYIAMSGPGRTQQHFKGEVDINNILAKYRKTGIIDHVKRAQARYGDFTMLGDYVGDLDKVQKATQAFEQLPAELRNQFKNSIPGFFEFIKEEKNFDQCVKWGIFEPKIEAAAVPAAPKETKSTPKTALEKPKDPSPKSDKE